jgi:hypothetical protein
MNEWLYAAIGIFGAIIGVIMHWGYILWQRRDIIGWTIDYWVKAWQDGKITVEEVMTFLNTLIEKLGLKDKIIVQKVSQ